jgi:hypothetical protein
MLQSMRLFYEANPGAAASILQFFQQQSNNLQQTPHPPTPDNTPMDPTLYPTGNLQ